MARDLMLDRHKLFHISMQLPIFFTVKSVEETIIEFKNVSRIKKNNSKEKKEGWKRVFLKNTTPHLQRLSANIKDQMSRATVSSQSLTTHP